MKKLILFITSTMLILATFAVNAQDYTFIAGDNSYETKLCVSAVNNNLKETKKYIKLSGLPHKNNIFNAKLAISTIQCNNNNLVQFTAQYNADKTHNYLNTKAPAKYKIKDEIKITDLAINTLKNPDKTIHIIVTSR